MFKKKKENQDRVARVRQPTLERSLNASAVFSYHANRAARPGPAGRQEDAPSAAERRAQPRHGLSRGAFIAVLVLAIGLVCFNLFLSLTPQVIPVSTTRSAVFLRSQQTYEAAAQAALAQSFLNRTKLTMNAGRVAQALRNQFPELTDVAVSVPLVGSRVQIHIQPATPQLLLSSGTELFVVDEAGRALMLARQVPSIEKMSLPVVTDQSGLAVTLGKPALPRSSVTFITEVVGQLKAKKVPISSLTLPPASSELDLRVSGVPYVVKFNLRGDARAEAGSYLAVKQQLEREHKTPGEYIDVRVEDRTYYK